MYFEENPWFLVFMIIVTVEAWSLAKVAARRGWRRWRGRSARRVEEHP